MRVRRVIVTFVGVGLALSGCSSAEPDVDQQELEQRIEFRRVEAEQFAQAQQRQNDCLQEAGVKVESHADGSTTIHDLAGDEKGDQTLALMKACEEEFPYPEPQPLVEVEQSYLYDLEVEAKACLEELGYPISDPPSRETWVALAMSGQAAGHGDPLWSPFLDIPPQDLEAVERDCPQPRLLDYGGDASR